MKNGALLRRVAIGSYIFFWANLSLADIGSTIEKLENIINNNLPSQYREDLNNTLSELKQQVGTSSDLTKKTSQKMYQCRAINTVLGNIKGIGDPMYFSIQAQESALANCEKNKKWESDCQYIRFDCETAEITCTK